MNGMWCGTSILKGRAMTIIINEKGRNMIVELSGIRVTYTYYSQGTCTTYTQHINVSPKQKLHVHCFQYTTILQVIQDDAGGIDCLPAVYQANLWHNKANVTINIAWASAPHYENLSPPNYPPFKAYDNNWILCPSISHFLWFTCSHISHLSIDSCSVEACG